MIQRGINSFLLGTIVCIALFGFLQRTDAQTVDDLKQKIEQKNSEIKKLEAEARKYRDEIAETQTKGKTLKGELGNIDRTIVQLRRDVVLTERKIERTQYEIEELGLGIRDKEAAIRKMRNGLAGLIQVVFEKDQRSIFEVLLRYKFLSDFFEQLEHVASIEEKLLSSLEAVRTLREELRLKKAQAEEKKEEYKGLSDALGDQKKIQDGLKRDRSDLLKSTQNQERQYQELLRETEKRQEAILREMEELEEELRKKIDPASLPTQKKGYLEWPANGRISQGYGETPFTKSRRGQHFYKFHNGIDIAGPLGTPIVAADDGKVMAIGDTDRYCPRGAYGKYIVVDHKNNLATMYAHLSLVRVHGGQEVRRGDIIGYMGSSGLSTGPHLHFTLYDARTVEIRLGSVGTCGLLPFGGSLNPLLYL